jgi:hypothetical protein
LLSALALALALLPSAARAQADDDYASLKSDSGLYCGEGVASLSEHGGDPLEAEKAALLAARGALAEAIEIRISVLTTDVLVGGSKAAEEHLSSKSRSISVVELANIRTRTFTDRPRAGDITVLAYITRTDYRRLLGGRLDDSPHGALTLFLGAHSLTQGADLAQAMGTSGAPLIYLPGFELAFGSWTGGLSAFSYRLNGSDTWDPRENKSTPAGGGVWHGNLQLIRVDLGYDWRIGKARFQPYVPLRLECQWMSLSEPASGVFPGASAGLGLRYWFSNHVALDLRGRWHQAFQAASPWKSNTDPAGGPFMIFPPQTFSVNMNGPELMLGFQVTD